MEVQLYCRQAYLLTTEQSDRLLRTLLRLPKASENRKQKIQTASKRIGVANAQSGFSLVRLAEQRKSKSDHAKSDHGPWSDIAANATDNSTDVKGRNAPHTGASPISAHVPPSSKQRVNEQNGNSVGEFPDWYEIKRILTHQRRGRRMYYKVLWQDGTISWLPEESVTAVATDTYWLLRNEQTKARKEKRHRRRRQ